MAKTETIDFGSFIRNDYAVKLKPKSLVATGLSSVVLAAPKYVFASSDDATFDNILGTVMSAFDTGIVLVIIFAGAAWCIGHRGKAIEILIGACCGYVLARHAVDIRDYLKAI